MYTVIYGGSGGIGSALARRVTAAGANVHLVARDPAKLTTIAAEIGATVTVGDVLDQACSRVSPAMCWGLSQGSPTPLAPST